MNTLPKSFLNKSTIEVAKALLGKKIIHKNPSGLLSGKIVETEAYLEKDPASHSFNGQTNRNSAMFGNAGEAYVYFTYGMHHCFNIVTNKKGIGEAVLIRALEPIEGIELMKQFRKTDEIEALCSGPARLVQAMQITKEYNGINLIDKNSPIILSDGNNINEDNIIKTKRIGISTGIDLPHRFYIKDNPFISMK